MLPNLIKASIANAQTEMIEPEPLPKTFMDTASPYDTNPQPVIGIVTQPLSSSLKKDPRLADKTSYIMQAYVHFMQAAGARVVPLVMTDD